MGSGLTYEIIAAKDIDPSQWNQFIEESPEGGIYSLYEYASCVAPNWEAIIVKKDNTWQAVMPFIYTVKWRFRASLLPPFVQYWGISFAPFYTQHTYKQYSEKKKCLQIILDQLSQYHLYVHQFSPQFDYPLPFHWSGYQIKKRYTYYLSLDYSEDELKRNMSSKLKNIFKKAEKSHIEIVEIRELKSFIELFHLQRAAGNDISEGRLEVYNQLEKLASWLIHSGKGHVAVAKDQHGMVLAGGLFARFKQKTLYLAGTYHPDKGQTGASSWLLWKSILKAKQLGDHIFDFEGSMIENIEAFFRRFGAFPIGFLEISKNRLPLIIQWIREYT